MRRYDAILRALSDSPWLVMPEKLEAVVGLLEVRAAGLTVDAATVEKVAAANQRDRQARVTNAVAVLPVVGLISQRMDLMQNFSGGVSTERLGREFDSLLNDPEIGAIVLDVDSPGGHYYGTPELADRIFQARGVKPVVAVANSLAASAAYWIASAADEVVVTPSGDLGSVGVVAVHYDQSKLNETVGVVPTYVTYGKYKAEFNPDAPLSDESVAELQRTIDLAGENFVKSLARYRGVSPGVVRDKFGQGRVYPAGEAVSRGMADRVDTLDATVARLAGSKRGGGSRRRAAIANRLAQFR